ncbi:glucans biosynthesis glucosyltransferase MdoH [Roseovarius aestuariivivens]|uniref:glucans biosynthesis glucosyltransferase MdoH n=1 Tax=Roseovarius aestuariivivens TaxID=1888910 RepID=UPI00108036F2|nr:glucans biosynthesis glucosyltransferase MdoH [Roseovarius aestuariivivens]
MSAPDLRLMPPEAPLAMPPQDLRRLYADPTAPGAANDRSVHFWRAGVFGTAGLATAGFAAILWGWFGDGGLSGIEATLLALMVFNFFWLCLTVSTVALGLGSMTVAQRPQGPTRPMRVALLMPVYNEVPWYVLGNARSMLEELRARGGVHEYAMFILSDTRDDAIARDEQDSVRALQATLSPGLTLYYRRRSENTDRKVGNIADWVQRWGGAYEAMLVLDADSLMTGRAIARLTDALARDPAAGLIQTCPQLIGAQTVFSRMQQFANGVYGIALAEGLARWTGQEGNYWGHNAIIRTRAFAASAGLPHLRSLTGRDQLIMSHDFVEAGLLRRAGWAVRVLPRLRGSYEETPPTLIDHVLRDRRWCQGNLQHLRLLGTPGLRPASRFHLFHGAMSYLLSPIWFALLVMWALIGDGRDASVLTYFSPDNPLVPAWPEMTEGRHVLIIALMYALLLAPKIMSIAAIPLTRSRFADYGGPGRFTLSVLSEVVLSVAYAPILMVQQMIAVFRTLLGLQRGWTPQARGGGRYGLGTLMICHAVETASGVALIVGMAAGVVSLWLMPIAASLALAVPLSALSGVGLRGVVAGWMGTRELWREPLVTQAARHYRAELRSVLERTGKITTPAE